MTHSAKIATPLLRWYGRAARDLPWRARKGTANPYHVAVSEFMLQQTTVATVIPYFNRFIRRWPDFAALARAPLDDVRAAWAGLGYYRRAAFLHRLAQAVVAEHGGRLPDQEAELRRLPGLGPYSAAAIAAIAFNRPAAVVDGNVERVASRLFMIAGDGAALRRAVTARMEREVSPARPGDFAQAMMELGALVCRPLAPDCTACPLHKTCRAFATGRVADYPQRRKKAAAPERYATVFVLSRADGRYLLRRRPEKGLLGGMWEFPSTPWQAAPLPPRRAAAHRPAAGRWQAGKTGVTHVFSHFRLHLTLQLGHSPTTFCAEDDNYRWMRPAEMATMALPTLTRKVALAAVVTREKAGTAGSGKRTRTKNR